ncbi:MAG: DUF4038 domain-containing protein [Calditrichaeota bacterium]|nr:MAG: DUF4038 domain-containing protein [Calditrichota bacterium]
MNFKIQLNKIKIHLIFVLIFLPLCFTFFLVPKSANSQLNSSPGISDVYVNGLSLSTASIHWRTDLPVISHFAFGLTAAYSDTFVVNSQPDTLFHVDLDSLQELTSYHFQIILEDSLGQLISDIDRQFSTPNTDLLSFKNITDDAGTGGPWQYNKTGGHAASFTDVTGDSLPDLYITMAFLEPVADLFFRNNDGKLFSEEAAARGIDDFDGGSHGALFFDVDNDGDYDLLNGTTDPSDSMSGRNNLYLNDGNGFFTDVSDSVNLPDVFWETRGLTALDYDRDGDLDLVTVTGYLGDEDPASDRNEFYHNNLMETGILQFATIDTSLLNIARIGQGITDTDWDGDGDIDLIAANRTGEVHFFRNNSGIFSEVPIQNLGLSAADSAKDGISTADIDNDGDLDLLLAGDNYGFLYKRSSIGTYAFTQAFSGTDGYMGSFADLDNDTDLDLVFAGDSLCYLNDGSGHFVPGPLVPIAVIEDPRSIGFADIDLDGDLDFAYACKRSKNQLFRNNLNSGNWLRLHLRSQFGQAGAKGASVRVYTTGIEKKLIGFQEALSVRGYLGQNEPVLHFGLATHEFVDVEVTFVDGSKAMRTNVPANQPLSISGPDADTAEPFVYNIHYTDITQTSITVNFYTNEPTFIQINYDTTEALTNQLESNLPARMHTFLLQNLQSGYEYLLRVRARDSVGNLAIKYSAFKTAGPIPQFGIFEETFVVKSSGNSFYLSKPEIDIEFTGVAGAALNIVQTIPAFWDGDSTFRVRFSPNLSGTWRWRVLSNDTSFTGKNGEFVCASKLPAGHSSRNGFVRVSQKNPYIFEHENGVAYFLLGDTQWSFSTDALSDFDFNRYVDVRSQQGFNYVHGVAYQIFPQGNDKNRGGQAFFQNNPDSLNPAFWQEFDARIEYLNEKGIVAGFMFAWGDGGWQIFQTQEQAVRFTEYLVQRYAAYNVFWIVAGEYEEAVVIGGYENIANAISAADPYGHPLTTHTVHSSADEADILAWQSFIYQQTTDPGLIATDRVHMKPVVNSEFGYEGYQSADSVRLDAWQIVMRGGFPVYGNFETYHYFAQMTDANLYSDGALYMQYLGEFFTRAAENFVNWGEISRFDSLQSGVYRATISSEKSIYYFENTESIDLPLPDLGEFWLHQHWFNTRSGEWFVPDSVIVTNLQNIVPPDSAYAVFFRFAEVLPNAVAAEEINPTKFSITQNYPNPFNIATRVKIGIPSVGNLHVELFDTRGRQVKSLFSGRVQPGSRQIGWDGTNRWGIYAANGVYILRAKMDSITGKSRTLSKRILLLK